MKFIIIFLLIANQIIFSQLNPGAKQISLANSDVALSNDVFAIFNNPAGLAQINWREIGIYYSPAPFGLSELANGYVAYHEPTSLGSFTIGAMSYGFELYRESKLALSYSNIYLKRFFYGLTFNFHSLNIKNYGNDYSFYLNVGALIYIHNNFRFGFFVNNINRATFSDEKSQKPTSFDFGFSYDILPELAANISVQKDYNFKPTFNFGIDYDLVDNLSIRSGFSNNPSKYTAGIGINYSSFSLDYAIFSHSDLGLTHQVGLIISFNVETNRKKLIQQFLNLPN